MLVAVRGSRRSHGWLVVAVVNFVTFVTLLLAPILAVPVRGEEEKAEEKKPAAQVEGSSPDAGGRIDSTGSGDAEKNPEPGQKPSSSLPLKILGNFFIQFPDLDLTTLTPRQLGRFLQRMNQDLCSCGNCTHDTVAKCYINDPGCNHVRTQAKETLIEVKAGQ